VLVDYIRRAMPFGDAESLTNDELYAVVAYVLNLNDIVDENFVLSKETWAQVKMPNRGGFFDDDREKSEKAFWNPNPCMKDCRGPAAITGRALSIDVTPDEKDSKNAVWNKDLATRQPVACAKKAKQADAAKSGRTRKERGHAASDGWSDLPYNWRSAGRPQLVLLAIAGGATASYGADVELGRYLSSECMTCHGTAKSDSTIPNIFGLGEAHFAEVLRAYRAKALPNPIMQTIAGRLNDEDIAALALYFETCQETKLATGVTMTEMTRRNFSLLAGASLATLSTPLFAPAVLGQAKPRLVVVGGGPGGAYGRPLRC
jgi:cytochrome c